MTRVPPPGGSSGASFSITPQNLSDTAPTFTNASKDIFEEELILDSLTESVIDELKVLQSLAKFAEALRNFKARVSEIMHCVGNEEAVVGEALEEAALAVDLNESLIGKMYQPLNPGYQPQPGTVLPLTPPSPKPIWEPGSVPGWILTDPEP